MMHEYGARWSQVDVSVYGARPNFTALRLSDWLLPGDPHWLAGIVRP